MTSALSHYRRFAGIITILWLGLFAAGLSVRAIADDLGLRPGSITVTARGEVDLPPDSAALNLTFSRQGDSIEQLESSVARDVASLLAGLEQAGVESSAIDSTRIMLQPRYRFDRQTQEQVSDGYRLDRSVAIDPIRPDQLATLLDLATDSGANRIDPPTLYSSVSEAAYLTALQRAMDQATARAQVLAESASATLGPVRQISTQDAIQRGPILLARATMTAESGDGGYQAGTLTVSATLTVEFDLLH